MIVLIVGISLFFISLIFHLVVWKLSMPRNQRRVLLIIFFFNLIIGLVLINIIDIKIGSFISYAQPSLANTIHIILIYMGLTLAYIVTYSGMEVDSPSLVIVNIIAANGKEGISLEHLYESLNDDKLVKPRVNDLLRDDMAIKVNGKYFTTNKGANMARLFNFYRKLLNVSASGG